MFVNRFVPLALAVVFAMIGSFILSRTLVPTMAMYLLKPHTPGTDEHAAIRTSVLVQGRRHDGAQRRQPSENLVTGNFRRTP